MQVRGDTSRIYVLGGSFIFFHLAILTNNQPIDPIPVPPFYLDVLVVYKLILFMNIAVIQYFIEGWNILQHDLNNIQEVLHFEHCVNL
jgi:hypothetical protein